MAKVHKIVMYVVDHEEFPDNDLVTTLQQHRHINGIVVSQEVKKLEIDYIGDSWDNHPLNRHLTLEQFEAVFQAL